MKQKNKKKTLLVALGGNALVRKGQAGTTEQQFENLKIPIRQLAKISQSHRIIITHGNGPQVGNLLLQQECCDSVPHLPLEILVAQTQGQIGYMIESTLDSQLMDLGIYHKPLVSLISYVVVDENDPAFKSPTKPIGPVFTQQQASELSYPTRETAKGWRRVVVSPQPVTIVEKREIKKLIQLDFIVICCGGGGIPVIRDGRSFCGVDAVIDKDLVSARLAEEVDADIFMIATDVEGAHLNFGQPEETFLSELSSEKAKQYIADGQFPAGSMRPKIEAALQFVEKKRGRAVICSIEEIDTAFDGRAGTQISVGDKK